MLFPTITAAMAGTMLILQIFLAFMVSAARGKHNTWVGDGGYATLQRLTRRHANLAENAGIFVAGFTLLELSAHSPIPLIYLCSAFVIVRLFHVIGLSPENTNNIFRLIGGVGTYLLGFLLGGLLIWISINFHT